MPLEVTSTFESSRYKPIEIIGKGGMGTVYKCTDTTVNRTVAIKVLNEDLDSSYIQRFQIEAKATAKLDHPNIVKVLDFGQLNDGKLYLCMEYLEGKGLDTVIEEGGPIPLEDATNILKQIASGLKHSHSNGVLHRDIKPSNIILIDGDKKGSQIKIVDFGIAKFDNDTKQELTRTGAALGSAAYMSPEAADGNKTNQTSDIYSYGCLMFELLTGRLPFIAQSYLETMMMHKNNAPPTLSEVVNEGYPENIEELVIRCLKKDPEARYQSFGEIITDLDNHDKIQPIGNLNELVDEFEASSSTDNKRMVYLVTAISAFFITGLAILLSAEKLISIFSKPEKQEQKEESLQTFIFNQIEDIKPKLTKNSKAHSYTVIGNVKGRKEDLNFLKNYKKVVSISFAADNLKGDTLKHLSTDYLTSFNTKGCEYDDNSFFYLGKAKNLNSVTLESAHGLSKNSFKAVAGLPKLSRLSIAKGPTTDEQFAPIKDSKRLIYLNITNCPLLTVKSFELIAKLPILEILVVKYSQINEEQIKMLTKSKSIKVFEISTLPNNYLKHLKAMKIEHLTIVKNETISEKEALQLGMLPYLKSIEFINCPNISQSLILKLKAKVPQVKVDIGKKEINRDFPLLNLKPEDKFSH